MENFRNNYTNLYNENFGIYKESTDLCDKYFTERKKDKNVDRKTCEHKSFLELKANLKECDSIAKDVTQIYNSTNINNLTLDELKIMFHFYYSIDGLKENMKFIKMVNK